LYTVSVNSSHYETGDYMPENTDKQAPDVHVIARMIGAIPEGTPPAKLPELLRPALALIAMCDPATQSAMLRHEIKSHFKLLGPDILAYERMVKDLAPRPADEGTDEDGVNTKSLVPNLIHWTRQAGVTKYLMYEDGRMVVKPQVTADGRDCRPKQDLNFMLPSEGVADAELPHDPAQLLKDVEGYIYRHIDMPSPDGYLILALWVIHTYMIEKFDTTPLLYFYGTKETGKSRAGQVLTHLAFRCEHTTSPTEACMFREAHLFHGALVLDEIKLLGQDGNKAVEQLLKSRYKRGTRVGRVNLNTTNQEDQIEKFDVYGPTVLASTEHVDDIIGSRCVKFIMQKNTRPEVECPIDTDGAETLRNRLLWLRTSVYNAVLPSCKPPARRRLGEIMVSLYKSLLLCDPSRDAEFKAFMVELETAKRDEESDTFEAEIAGEIIAFINEKNVDTFTTKDITTRLNAKVKDEKFKHGERGTANRITKFGFRRTRERNVRIWHVSPATLARLQEQYDIKPPEPKPAANLPGILNPGEPPPF
jgi:hypothetical protein